jgi:hypothetical protein
MSLISQINSAVQNGDLIKPLTTAKIKEWVLLKNIVKDDGKSYAESSVNSILSNSDIQNNPTSNKNPKILQGNKPLSGNKKEYQ